MNNYNNVMDNVWFKVKDNIRDIVIHNVLTPIKPNFVNEIYSGK
jgi:hypothetical protein